MLPTPVTCIKSQHGIKIDPIYQNKKLSNCKNLLFQ